MTGTTFDSLAAARDLEAAGIERRQAEAIAASMRDAVGAGHDALATKADLRELVTRGEFYRALWIQAAALIGAQIAIAGLIVTLLS